MIYKIALSPYVRDSKIQVIFNISGNRNHYSGEQTNNGSKYLSQIQHK